MKVRRIEREEQSALSPKKWRCDLLIGACCLAGIGHAMFTPMLCHEAGQKFFVLAVLYLLILARIVYAWVTREAGTGWKWYAAFIILAPAWFEGIWFVLVESRLN